MPLLEGYEHEFVPNTSKAPGTHHFGGLKNPRLSARLRAFDPDAVLLVGYNYWSLIDLVLTWPARRAPLMLRGDSHRLLPEESWRGRFKAMLLRLLFTRFSAFLYVGTANRRYFELHGVEPARLFHAPHAVDNARFMADQENVREAAFEWRRELGISDANLVVLFAGKFEQKKRPLDLLEAFLRRGQEGVTLLFVGAGELESELRRRAASRANVVFAPFQNQSYMPRTYAACDLFVLPSHGRYETWGLAVNEAMCLGKPVVVSSHVGCAADLVEPGRTGLVFEAGDVAALERALEQALADRARLRQWGEQARALVREFSYEAAGKGLLRAFAHVTRTGAKQAAGQRERSA